MEQIFKNAKQHSYTFANKQPSINNIFKHKSNILSCLDWLMSWINITKSEFELNFMIKPYDNVEKLILINKLQVWLSFKLMDFYALKMKLLTHVRDKIFSHSEFYPWLHNVWDHAIQHDVCLCFTVDRDLFQSAKARQSKVSLSQLLTTHLENFDLNSTTIVTAFTPHTNISPTNIVYQQQQSQRPFHYKNRRQKRFTHNSHQQSHTPSSQQQPRISHIRPSASNPITNVKYQNVVSKINKHIATINSKLSKAGLSYSKSSGHCVYYNAQGSCRNKSCSFHHTCCFCNKSHAVIACRL